MKINVHNIQFITIEAFHRPLFSYIKLNVSEYFGITDAFNALSCPLSLLSTKTFYHKYINLQLFSFNASYIWQRYKMQAHAACCTIDWLY